MNDGTRLVLVRHGESTWNADGRLQGQADPPLSARGRRQAAEMAGWLREFAPDRVVCSDLARARETASLLGWPDAEADERWREVDVGDWTGRSSADVRAHEAEAYWAWREGRLPPPGGEPYGAFAARVHAAGEELLGAPGTTVVVAHGGPIRSLCSSLLGLELRRLAGVGNASATVIESAPGGLRLAAYNVSGNGHEDLA